MVHTSKDSLVSQDVIDKSITIPGYLQPEPESNPAIPEQAEIKAVGPKQSDAVFENIYEQIKVTASGADLLEKGRNIMRTVKEGFVEHVDTVEKQGLVPRKALEEVWQKMVEYIGTYQGTSKFDSKKKEVEDLYVVLQRHVTGLVSSGAVDSIAASVFLKKLPALKYIGDYNSIIKNVDVSNDVLKDKNTEFATQMLDIYNQYPGRKSDQGGFYHFNEDVPGDVKSRLYISADLNKAPHEVASAWFDALKETGLQDKVYFKIPYGLSKRFETIIVYVTDQTDPADMEKITTAFTAKVPDTKLNKKDMPTGTPLRRGLSMGFEPTGVNKLLKFMGHEKESQSYNSLMSALTELSLELAYRKVSKTTTQEIMPKMLKADAQKYFEQLMRLSGINPESMVPNSQGGKLPVWAEKILAQAK